MTSGYIVSKGEPSPDEILEALREAISENPRLTEMPSEEITRQLVLGGHLQEEPSPALVAGHAGRAGGRGEYFRGRRALRGGQPHTRMRPIRV
jgi:hypothetical protein